jgi:hypothetical protein
LVAALTAVSGLVVAATAWRPRQPFRSVAASTR